MAELVVPVLEAMPQASLEVAAPAVGAEITQSVVTPDALTAASSVDAAIANVPQIGAADATKAIQDLSTVDVQFSRLGEDGKPIVPEKPDSSPASVTPDQQVQQKVPEGETASKQGGEAEVPERQGQPPSTTEKNETSAQEPKVEEMSEDDKIKREIDDGVKKEMGSWIDQHPEPARGTFSSNIDYQKVHGEWSRQYASQERQSHRDTAEAVQLDRWEKAHPRPDPATDPEGHRQWVKDKAAQKYDGGSESKNEEKGKSEEKQDNKKKEEEQNEKKDEKEEKNQEEDKEAAEKLRRLMELKKAKAFYDQEIKRLEGTKIPQEQAALQAHKIAKDLIEKEIAKTQAEIQSSAGKGNRFMAGALTMMTLLTALESASHEGV